MMRVSIKNFNELRIPCEFHNTCLAIVDNFEVWDSKSFAQYFQMLMEEYLLHVPSFIQSPKEHKAIQFIFEKKIKTSTIAVSPNQEVQNGSVFVRSVELFSRSSDTDVKIFKVHCVNGNQVAFALFAIPLNSFNFFNCIIQYFFFE
jgi:hypothetical protein